MILWRAALLLVALVFFAIAASDVYEMVTRPGVLAYTLGFLHCLVFFTLGVACSAGAVFGDGGFVRQSMIDFGRDVFSRRNLGEAGLLIALAVTVALVAAAIWR